MQSYTHKAQYYETDQMGVVHHSNYIRWFEEARVSYMELMGMRYDQMEADGILCPVLEVNCTYKKSVRFSETVRISVRMIQYTGTRMTLSYRIFNEKDELCVTGQSSHCFLNRQGRPLSLKKSYPAYHETFEKALGADQEET